MTSRNFALVTGLAYTLVGLLGFLPGVLTSPPAGAPPVRVDAGYGYLLGLFPVNLLHTLVHLALGVWGLLVARNGAASRNYAASLAVIFGLLTVMGIVPGLNTVFGLIPLFGHDIWLHGLTAVAAAYFGFRETRIAERVRDRTRRAA